MHLYYLSFFKTACGVYKHGRKGYVNKCVIRCVRKYIQTAAKLISLKDIINLYATRISNFFNV